MKLRFLVLSLSLVGCYLGTEPAAGDPAPPPPATSTTPDVQHGLEIFGGTCAGCHNPYALHTWKVAGLEFTREQMITRIRNGGVDVDYSDGAMPPITTDRVSDADLPDLLAYLETIDAIGE